MIECKVCGKKLIKQRKSTCSWKCKATYVNSLNKGRPSKFKGVKNRWTDGQRKKISESQKGKKWSPEQRKNSEGKLHPPSRKGIKLTPEQRIKKSLTASKGKNHYNWQGGKTNEASLIRNSIETRLWREAVFARDNWTCQECKKRGGKLEAHHIKSFSKYPELRLAIDNGITLCFKHHNKTKIGRRTV